ncbi:MAG: hypothetical protein RLW62_13105 [Gammaproteobacteria bacterium]
MRITVLAAALAVGASASAAGFMPWTDVMKMADTDKDGMLTPHEVVYFKGNDSHTGFRPFMVDHFADFDTDGDGMVSAGELAAAKTKLGMSDEEMSKAFFERQGFMPRQQN